MSYHRKGRMALGAAPAFEADGVTPRTNWLGNPIDVDGKEITGTDPGGICKDANGKTFIRGAGQGCPDGQTSDTGGGYSTGISLIDWLTGALGVGGTAASSLSASDFNSTSVPGVCKPTNKPALLAVQEFQRQLNRVAQAKNLPKIGADGDVGAGTMMLFRSVQGVFPTIAGDASSCMGVAPMISSLTPQLKALADSLGVSGSVSSPRPMSQPSFIPPGANAPVPVQAGLLSSFSNLSTIEKVAVVGGLAGAAVVFMGKRKGRRR